MKHSTLYLLLSEKISLEIFLKCDIQPYPEDDAKLADIIKSIHQLGLSVNALNIWEFSNSSQTLGRYMQIVNDIGWKEIERNARN